LDNVMVFCTNDKVAEVVTNAGMNAYSHAGLGEFPTAAAGAYGDNTFIKMMWLKISPVYLVHRMGFNVLFQDADMIWFKDPLPYLAEQPYDVIFQDDGARNDRYSPLWGNSGFYYLKNNQRAVFVPRVMLMGFHEVYYMQSHQEVLMQHVMDLITKYSITYKLLPMELFPSGREYHHNKPLMKKITSGQHDSYVFHMCWTTNKVEKIKYLKDLGFWYVKDECTPDALIESPTLATQCIV